MLCSKMIMVDGGLACKLELNLLRQKEKSIYTGPQHSKVPSEAPTQPGHAGSRDFQSCLV